MQAHIHKYISEESTYVCIRKQDAPSSKVIIFLLHAHVRGKHCSAATAQHHRCSRAAVTVTERPWGSTQIKSMIITSSPQNLYSSQKGNNVLKSVFTMPDRKQEGGVLSKRPQTAPSPEIP